MTQASGWALLDAIEPSARRDVLAAARRRKFKRGEVICHAGDPGDSLHLIDKGFVAVSASTPLGDIATMQVLGPGGFFGELAVLHGSAMRAGTVTALEPTETLALHASRFEELRATHLGVDRFLVDALVQQVRDLSDRLLHALYQPAETRLDRSLATLAATFDRGDGTATVPLTQEQIAGMAGVTRQTANKRLRELEDDGVLNVGRGRIDILDRARLVSV